VNELKILNQHKIEMLELKEDVTINKRSSKNLSYIIPVEQQNTRLINAILINKPYSKTVYFMTFQLEF
jgi:hypothetical protein